MIPNCPKCSCKLFNGPYYHDGSYHPTGWEHLEYICARCGYKHQTECDDAKSKKEQVENYLLENNLIDKKN